MILTFQSNLIVLYNFTTSKKLFLKLTTLFGHLVQ